MQSVKELKKKIEDDKTYHQDYDEILRGLSKFPNESSTVCNKHIVDMRYLKAKNFLTFDTPDPIVGCSGYYNFPNVKLTDDGMVFISEQRGFIAEGQKLLREAEFAENQFDLLIETSKSAKWANWIAFGTLVFALLMGFKDIINNFFFNR